jgi:hypothetical protein
MTYLEQAASALGVASGKAPVEILTTAHGHIDECIQLVQSVGGPPPNASRLPPAPSTTQ